MNQDNIYNEALKKFGYRKQLLMMIEKMSELTQAILKQFRMSDTFFYTDAIIEEMADVDIMLMELKSGLDTDGIKIYENVYCDKLYRLSNLINEEK